MAGPRVFKDIEEYPEVIHGALKVITETCINFIKANIDSGVSGFFLATQNASKKVNSKELFTEFGAPVRSLECYGRAIQGITNLIFNGLFPTIPNGGTDHYFSGLEGWKARVNPRGNLVFKLGQRNQEGINPETLGISSRPIGPRGKKNGEKLGPSLPGGEIKEGKGWPA